MDAPAVIRQFYGRREVEDYDLKLVIVPDGSLQGAALVKVVPRRYFRFFELPAEIRNRIYSLVVEVGKVTIDNFTERQNWATFRTKCVMWGFPDRGSHIGLVWNSRTWKWDGASPSPLSLLLVNKQIHAEGTRLAYGQPNSFFFPTRAICANFIKTIGSSAKFLQIVRVDSDITLQSFRQICKHLEPATGIRKLFVGDELILSHVRQAARIAENVDSWASVFSRIVRSLLLASQATFQTNQTSWLALDIVQVTPESYTDPDDPKSDLEKQANRDTIAAFLVALRKAANVYLQEE